MKNRLTSIWIRLARRRCAARSNWSSAGTLSGRPGTAARRRISKRCWPRIRTWPTSCGRISIACGCLHGATRDMRAPSNGCATANR